MNDSETQSITLSDEEIDRFTIEGMKSQEFSIGIFAFMMAGIILFAVIMYRFISDARKQKMRRGEMILYGWLVLGLIGAIIYGAAQLLFGQLI